MFQRKPLAKKPSIFAQMNPVNHEEIFFNLEGRKWLSHQVDMLGRGKYLLRKSTVRTPLVKQKAYELSHGRDALHSARNMVHFASSIEFIEVSDITAAKFYNKQTADDIVSGRKIPTFRGTRYGLLGCQTFCATLISLLRAAKPSQGKITNVRAVRTLSPATMGKDGRVLGMPHTIVTFMINGVKYIADPYKKGYSFLGSNFIGLKGTTLVEESKIAGKIALLKKQKAWKESLDTADFGIDSFEKYVEESRAHGEDLAKQTDFERFLAELKKQS